MPKKSTIEAVEIEDHGNKRYRVIIPKDLRDQYGGQQARYYPTKAEGTKFAGQLMQARSKPQLATFTLLPTQAQNLVTRAIENLGAENAHRLDEAVALLLAKDNNKATEQEATVETAMDECVATAEANKRTGIYVTNLESTFKKFKAVFGQRMIHTITTGEVQDWLDKLAKSSTSKITYMTHIRALFNYAKEVRQYLKDNPIEHVRWPEDDDKDDEPCVLTVDQARSVLVSCLEIDPAMIPTFAICLFAGTRVSELKRLIKEDVRDDGHIVLERRKTKGKRSRRVIEMLPVLKEWLALGCELPVINWRRRYDAIREHAGLIELQRPEGITGSGSGNVRYAINETGWGKNPMRHSFITYHLKAYGEQSQLALDVGHDDPDTMFKKYRAILLPDGSPITKAMGEAFFALRPKAVKAWMKANKKGGISGQGASNKNAP